VAIARDAKGELRIDYSYFEDLKAKAMEAIMQFDISGNHDFTSFIQ
jgi:hypothetical protein